MNKLSYKSKNKVSRLSADTFILPKFAKEIHNIISSKYEHTYIVGGAVRNFFLKKKITDVDIATSATPTQIVQILEQSKIKFSALHSKLGVIVACKGDQKIEITTFRTEIYKSNRFPTVRFVKSAKKDSERRDFTVNALYYSPQTKQILDFHNGLKDIHNKTLRFIGNPLKKITEDPLRIVRAHRFALQYNLKIDRESLSILNSNLNLLKKVSKTRLQKEINAVKQKNLRNTLQKVIHSNA